MKRKNMPGCYCCCVCPDLPVNELPEATIPGYTGEGWLSAGGNKCCAYQDFTPNAPVKTRLCSDVVDTYTINFTCHTEYWAGKAFPTARTFPESCEDYLANCCDYLPTFGWEYWGSSDIEEINTIGTRVFGVASLEKIRVWLLRSTVLCNEEPVCKYMVLTQFYFSWITKWLVEEQATFTQETYPADCMKKPTPAVFDGSCTLQVDIDCDADEHPLGQTICFEFGDVCLSRVKFFDQFPSGNLAFTASDIPETCQFPEMTCAANFSSCEPNWSESVCIETDVLCEPDWCSNPPTILQNSTTYLFGVNFNLCGSTSIGGSCCDPGFLTICANPPVECTENPPASKTVNCFTIECPQDDPDYEQTCTCAWGQSIGTANIWYCPIPLTRSFEDCQVGALCCCANRPCVALGPNGIQPFELKYDCNDNSGLPPCGPCCEEYCTQSDIQFAGDDCIRCRSSVGEGLTGAGTVAPKDSTATLDITCENGLPPDFCFSPPNITLTIQPLS